MSFFLGHAGASPLSGRLAALGGILRGIQVILVLSARKLYLSLWLYHPVLWGFMEKWPHSSEPQVHVLFHLGDSMNWSRGKKSPGTMSQGCCVWWCRLCTTQF